MKNKILWAVTLLPLAVTTIVIQLMEDNVPMHEDIAGNIDRWGSKYENYLFPVIIIVMTLFWKCFLRYFRKKQITAKTEKEVQEAKNNEKLIYAVALGMAIMYNVMHYFIMYGQIIVCRNNMSTDAVDINVITNVLGGIFMLALGNMMPKAKRNSVAGVRTVWSMENDQTWATSNRFGGKVLMITGILIVAETIFIGGFTSTLITLGLIIAASVIAVVYSYKAYKKYK